MGRRLIIEFAEILGKRIWVRRGFRFDLMALIDQENDAPGPIVNCTAMNPSIIMFGRTVDRAGTSPLQQKNRIKTALRQVPAGRVQR